MKNHIGTQEVRIDLSATAPRVFIDGEEVACAVDVHYWSPPVEGLSVKRIEVARRHPPEQR